MTKMWNGSKRRITVPNAHNDPTYPNSPESERARVRELIRAMLHVPVGTITPALLNDWLLDKEIVERAAWYLLGALVGYQRDGLRSAYGSFEDLMRTLCAVLKSNKSACTWWIGEAGAANPIEINTERRYTTPDEGFEAVNRRLVPPPPHRQVASNVSQAEAANRRLMPPPPRRQVASNVSQADPEKLEAAATLASLSVLRVDRDTVEGAASLMSLHHEARGHCPPPRGCFSPRTGSVFNSSAVESIASPVPSQPIESRTLSPATPPSRPLESSSASAERIEYSLRSPAPSSSSHRQSGSDDIIEPTSYFLRPYDPLLISDIRYSSKLSPNQR